jgi:hypothetical protein
VQSPILRDGSGTLLLDFLVVHPKDLTFDVSMLFGLYCGFRLLQYLVIQVGVWLAFFINQYVHYYYHTIEQPKPSKGSLSKVEKQCRVYS